MRGVLARHLAGSLRALRACLRLSPGALVPRVCCAARLQVRLALRVAGGWGRGGQYVCAMYVYISYT